jgi:D-alanine-D-alanine ligase
MKHTPIILFGGRSDERHVSVASAQNIARTVDSALLWFWAPNGAVHDIAAADLLAHVRPFEVDFVPSRPAIWPDLEQALDTLPVEDPVFFLALHGGEGEDGTVQRMLEQRGIPFTGSGSEASAAAFDKGTAKERVRGVVQIAESRIARDAAEAWTAAEDLLSRHERIVLKPLAAGSSRGLFFVQRGDALDTVMESIARLNIPYIVEQYISGRELTVGVIDRGEGPVALPVVEIVIERGFSFDYESKYLGKGSREICPAEIDESVALAAQKTALAAHQALGCEGYSRTDIMAAEDGPYFLELNTLPGMTGSSLVPQELKAVGIELRRFVDDQLQLALERQQKRLPAAS